MPLLPSLSPVKLVWLTLLAAVVTTSAAAPYKGAIVVDTRDGRVLFEDHSDYAGPPASVTKLMTFLIVQDAIRAGTITLQTPVTVTAQDAGMGGTQVWLKQGEVFTVDELLYALLIQSANDAAHALSHAAAPDRQTFVNRMNDRARELGMNDTIWRTPHGLPPKSRRLDETDQTSPRDLATLSLLLLRETDILRYTSVEKRNFGEGKRPAPVAMDNHNNLLGKAPGVDGLKTGFTRAAGYCLSATASRHGNRVIAVIMGGSSSQERDIEMVELLNHAFAQLPARGPITTVTENPIRSVPAQPPAMSTPTPTPAAAPSTPPAATPAPTTDDEPTVKFELPPRRPKSG